MKLRSLLTSLVLAASIAAGAQGAQAPKYIFYFIGDGMGMGPVMTTLNYMRLVHPDAPALTLTKMPVASWCMTYSASSPVTDSAAAGTALSAGTKTVNGMLGVAPDSTAVISIAKQLHDMGYGVGVVTSVAPDDATPGAFYAHVPQRSMYYEIGRDAATCGYEFIGGAALRGARDKDGNDTGLVEYIQQNGVTIAHGLEQLQGATTRRVMLLSPEGIGTENDISYTIDSVAGALSLPAMTQACLDHLLAQTPDRFFMMVEGGNIDHALHANDGGAAVKEILNFDSAIEIAYNFYLAHPDETMILITADHDTGGMALGNKFLNYTANLQYIDYQRVSKEEFENYCKGMLKSRRTYTWDDMREYLTEHFGFWGAVPVTDKQEQALRKRFDDTFELRNTDSQETMYANFNLFAVEVYKVFNDVTGIGFTTNRHTGNPVPLFAIGREASRFDHITNNIDIPVILREITGIRAE